MPKSHIRAESIWGTLLIYHSLDYVVWVYTVFTAFWGHSSDNSDSSDNKVWCKKKVYNLNSHRFFIYWPILMFNTILESYDIEVYNCD